MERPGRRALHTKQRGPGLPVLEDCIALLAPSSLSCFPGYQCEGYQAPGIVVQSEKINALCPPIRKDVQFKGWNFKPPNNFPWGTKEPWVPEERVLPTGGTMQ